MLGRVSSCARLSRTNSGRLYHLYVRSDALVREELNWNPPRRWFPFDGECDASRDADITIVFNDGENLKANARHLQEASPVLRNALAECKHTGTLVAGDDSQAAWIVLLNLVHPARRVAGPDRLESHNLQTMELYAELALKYGVACMHDYADSGLCRAVDEAMARVPLHIHPNQSTHYFADNSFLFKSSRVAAKFRLEAAKEANASHFELLLKRMKAHPNKAEKAEHHVGAMIAKHVASLSRINEHHFASVIAERALRLLCL